MFLANDMAELDLEQSKKLYKDLGEALRLAHEEPPAPAPLFRGDGTENDKQELASCGPKPKTADKWEAYLYIGRHECDTSDAIRLYKWLDKALTYLEVLH